MFFASIDGYETHYHRELRHLFILNRHLQILSCRLKNDEYFLIIM
jgi:hypothetical protein